MKIPVIPKALIPDLAKDHGIEPLSIPEEKVKKMDQISFLGLLSEDLTLEYAAYIQYKQHEAVINGVYFAFASVLAEHADDERGHAELLANHLNYLGFTPTTIVGPTKTSPVNIDMLKQDLDGENTAIRRYTERIAQARARGDFGTEAILLGILKDEQEHANDIETILGVSK
jgi:bacterioferritin